MNRTALSVVALAVGAVLTLGLFNVYKPQTKHVAHDVFDKVRIGNMKLGASAPAHHELNDPWNDDQKMMYGLDNNDMTFRHSGRSAMTDGEHYMNGKYLPKQLRNPYIVGYYGQKGATNWTWQPAWRAHNNNIKLPKGAKGYWHASPEGGFNTSWSQRDENNYFANGHKVAMHANYYEYGDGHIQSAGTQLP